MNSTNPRKFKPEVDEHGHTLMTKKYIKVLCEEQDLYSTPSLNDKLYLHYKGFHKIQDLEEYTNLCTIYLEHNLVKVIENVSHLKYLRFLYLHNNMIKKIENLDGLENLVTLNLSNNQISKIENLAPLVKLTTFYMNHNRLSNPDSIQGLAECSSLTDVDLSHNYITYGDKLLDIFEKLPNLACFYLKGNPLVDNFPNYRKKMVCILGNLKHLDTKSVTTEERRLAQAWLEGGKDAVFLERLKLFNEKEQAKEGYLQIGREKERKVNEMRIQEQEKVEKEFTVRREELMRKKEELSQIMPIGYRVIVRRIEVELEALEKEYEKREDIINERLLRKVGGMTKFSVVQTTINDNNETEFVNVKKQEFEEYIERKNLLWLIQQPTNSQPNETPNQEAGKNPEEGNNIDNSQPPIPTRFKFTKTLDNELDGLMKSQAYDFKKVVDMMDNYISSISQENWTLSKLLENKEFRDLYLAIQKISSYLNSQNTAASTN